MGTGSDMFGNGGESRQLLLLQLLLTDFDLNFFFYHQVCSSGHINLFGMSELPYTFEKKDGNRFNWCCSYQTLLIISGQLFLGFYFAFTITLILSSSTDSLLDPSLASILTRPL